jgi:DNA-binding transcriptional MocR family regulator
MATFPVISLDRSRRRPLYRQIKEALIAAIERGDLPPLTRLPATRALARQLGVNRITVVTAYNELAAEGYISAHVGRGSFVLDRGAGLLRQDAVPLPRLRLPGDWSAHRFHREMIRLARRPDIISFAPGMPATDLLPADTYRLALNAVLRRDGPEVLQYAPIEGYPGLRRAVAAELNGLGIPAEVEQLLITGGAEQALALVLRTLLRPGDTVLIEQPTYLHVLDLLADAGVEVVAVPCDEEGIIPTSLAEALAVRRPRLVYLTPTYQNPTGACMSASRRQEVLELTRAQGVLLVEDDVYRHLWLRTPPPPPLTALAQGRGVVYINGYSKCLLPGAGIGYLVAPPDIEPTLTRAHQTLEVTANELHQRALALYIEEGEFERHLQRLRSAYRERLEAMMAALARFMPAATRWTHPQGGLFLWVALPADGPGATTLYVHALELGVTFAPGHFFYPVGSAGATHTLRLNFTLYPPEITTEGIRRLARAWERAAGLR